MSGVKDDEDKKSNVIIKMICEECGEESKGRCDCWRHRPLYRHALSDIYDLGLWCQRCHEDKDCYCSCYRVREMVEYFNKGFHLNLQIY